MEIKLVDNGFFKKYNMTHGPEVLLSSDRIGLFYTYDANADSSIKGTLHKWGDHVIVKISHDDFIARTKHLDGKLGTPFYVEAVVGTDSEITEDELNKIINCTGYIGLWHDKNHGLVGVD